MIRDSTFSKLVMNKTIQTCTLTKQKKRTLKTISRSLRTIANTSSIVFAKIHIHVSVVRCIRFLSLRRRCNGSNCRISSRAR